jgi:iron-sulfur cluster repair protein YtfE (RIC family)
MKTNIEITKNSIIGEIIKEVPGANKVIEKYFGNGCFTCPGLNVESISFGAAMHNTDPETVIADLKKLLESENGS